jgi:alditol oxidase
MEPDDPASGGQLTNWAGNYRYGRDNLHQLMSIEQVRMFVKEHDSLKVLGTRHCFNGIADSTHALISLKSMDRVVALDPESRTVTVESGMSYGQLCPYLHEKGFALHNLASLPLWGKTRVEERAPDRRALGGEPYGANGSARPLV